MPQHASKGEFDDLKNLKTNKSDKGNSIVTVGRDKNIERVKNFLNGQSDFLVDFNSTSEETRRHAKPVATRSGKNVLFL